MVGLVDHGDLDRIEAQRAPVDQVAEATRARDHHIDGALQPPEVTVDGHPAVERFGAQADRRGEQRYLPGDLVGQLAGGNEHQPGGSATFGSGAPGGQRDAERDRLARPGRGLAADVASIECRRNRLRLDGERREDALRRECFHDRCGDAEFVEGGTVRAVGPCHAVATQPTLRRSTTNTNVSPPLITLPAPRLP